MPLTPWVLQSSLLAVPSAVQSTWPMVTSALSLYFSASFSQVGASRLQWPHQGAKNLTKATPVLTSASKLSLSSLATGEAAAGSGTLPSWDAALPASPLVVVTNSFNSDSVRAPLYVSIFEPALKYASVG